MGQAGRELAGEIDLTLFVACYNEEANIVATLETLTSALKETKLTWEVIVIDDASSDESVERIRGYIVQHPQYAISLTVNEQNKGLAQNFIEGAFLGRGTYYRLVCGDDVEPKETFLKVFQHIGKADLIIPYHVELQGRTAGRRILSRTYTMLVNLISGHRLHYYNGLAIYRRYHVQRWHSNCYGFGFQADLVTRLLDECFSYLEVPIVGRDRQKGSSKALTVKNFLSVAHTFLGIALRRIGNVAFRQPRSGGAVDRQKKERARLAISDERKAA